MKCCKCQLAKTRKGIVKGKGRLPNRFLVIGGYPDEADELVGEPFTGPAGRLLVSMLKSCGIDLNDCYFMNVVLCRPADSKTGLTRFPKMSEQISCARNVMKVYDYCNDCRVILVGKISQEFYARTFPDHVAFYDPGFIEKNGGIAGAYYSNMIRKAKGVLSEAN